MRHIIIASFLSLSVMGIAGGCKARLEGQGATTGPRTTEEKGLKDYYRGYFPVGVAVNMSSLRGADSALILREFNSITPENDMKIGPIHPTEDRYHFSNADAIIGFAQRHGLKVRGHNLVWHYASQTPQWIFRDKEGKRASKELVLQRLKDHITTVVSRYKGRVYAWDVANEVISDKKDEYLRPSEWYAICGEDYIFKAFQWAHEADPDALLFYNDYNEISPVKREKIYRLVKSLKDAGIPVHGIGLQAHWAVNEPSEQQLTATLSRFKELGVQLQITELDISVYPKEHDARAARPEDAHTAFTPERESAQLEKYKMCFRVFRQFKDVITSVTFWNISDQYSWLDNFPVQNRKDYPLLFDTTRKPKKAYWEVVNF